jgi:hypothetical protein
LCSFEEGSSHQLWVGGSIQIAGTKPSVGIVRWGDVCECSAKVYCTAKTDSLGCLPSMSVSVNTRLSASEPLSLFAQQVRSNQFGLLLYGTSGADARRFHGGTLCVSLPLHRTGAQWSAGSRWPADCSGSFAMDFKSYVLTGADPSLSAGTSVHAQYWYRDPDDPNGCGFDQCSGLRALPMKARFRTSPRLGATRASVPNPKYVGKGGPNAGSWQGAATTRVRGNTRRSGNAARGSQAGRICRRISDWRH